MKVERFHNVALLRWRGRDRSRILCSTCTIVQANGSLTDFWIWSRSYFWVKFWTHHQMWERASPLVGTCIHTSILNVDRILCSRLTSICFETFYSKSFQIKFGLQPIVLVHVMYLLIQLLLPVYEPPCPDSHAQIFNNSWTASSKNKQTLLLLKLTPMVLAWYLCCYWMVLLH